MAVSIQKSVPIIVFWVPTGESGEFYMETVNHGSIARCDGCQDVQFHKASQGLIVSFKQNAGMTVLTFDNGVRAVIVDRATAYDIWQPTLSTDPHAPLNETLLVRGPYLVRSASMENETVALTGDYDDATVLEVFGALSTESGRLAGYGDAKVTFNGKEIVMRKTKYGSLLGSLTAGKSTVKSIAASIPTLTDWKVHNGLPERMPDYDASGAGWVLANNSSTLNPWQPRRTQSCMQMTMGFINRTCSGVEDSMAVMGRPVST